MNINEDLLKARMMRGAVTGQAAEEKSPMKYCQGKLDNNRPCRIVVLGDEEYCRRHKIEIEALEAGAPLQPGRVERPQEDIKMAKHRCGKTNCTRAVKNAGDMCWQHKGLEDQVAAGSVAGDLGKEDLEIVATDNAAGSPVELDHYTASGMGEIAGIASPPPELIQAPAGESSALSRLLKRPEPLSPTSIILDFNLDEYAAIQSEKVTAEEIKRLTLMLIAGELYEAGVPTIDPLAKSRLHAVG